jgi:hypothetical protein
LLEAAHTVPQVSRYVAQVVGSDSALTSQASFEIMRGDLKRSRIQGHRTPWQVLEDFAAFGDDDDLHLFNEWEQATRGVHAMHWSRGLRQRVGVDHKSDDEIVAEEIGGEIVYVFERGPAFSEPYEAWHTLCRVRGARSRLLDLVESGGDKNAIDAFLEGLLVRNRSRQAA